MFHARFLTTRHFGTLDGLRCLSILAVIWHHGPGMKTQIPLLAYGFYGVDLFFVVSGFLITTLLLRERDATGQITLRNFYARRSLRIFPLYYTILLLYAVLIFALERNTKDGGRFFSNLPYFLTYTSNWFVPLASMFAFSWSLATEEQFYCVWPWVERRFRGKGPVFAMLGILLVSQSLMFAWPAGAKLNLVFTIIRSISAAVCLGVLAAHLLHSRAGYDIARRFLGFRYASVFGLCLVGVVVALEPGRTVVDVAMAIAVVSCVVREDHVLRPVLTSVPLRYIGTISYGMYLMHGLAYNVLDALRGPVRLQPHSIGEFLVCVALTVAGASLSYRYYESVFLKLKTRFSTERPRMDACPAPERSYASSGRRALTLTARSL